MLARTIFIAMLFATACTPNPVRNSTPPPDRLQSATQEPFDITSAASPEGPKRPTQAAPSPSPVGEDGLQKKLTQLVIDDLAIRLNVTSEGISVISTQTIVWPNAALGCPLPGKVYAQGRIPGFRIQLAAKGTEYSYHTDRAGRFIFCPGQNPDIQVPSEIPITPGEIDDGQPWMPVN